MNIQGATLDTYFYVWYLKFSLLLIRVYLGQTVNAGLFVVMEYLYTVVWRLSANVNVGWCERTVFTNRDFSLLFLFQSSSKSLNHFNLTPTGGPNLFWTPAPTFGVNSRGDPKVLPARIYIWWKGAAHGVLDFDFFFSQRKHHIASMNSLNKLIKYL